MLENHPLLWHTRSIQLTVLAFLFWIIAFVSGYSMTDLEVLRVFSINRYYEKSGFYLFHIAIVIIVLAIWAFLFFKNNAFKAIYPIGRLYFQKTLLLLFIPFTLLTSLYIPFTKGLHVKTRGILSKEQLLTDFQTITLASAFLPVDGSNYSIGNKCYPGPFPLKRITFNKGTKKWSDEYLNIMVPSNKSERVKHRDYSYSDSNTTIVEARKMQFFRDTSYAIEKCHWATAISKIYKIDTNVIHLELNSIWNYSNSDFIELYSSFKDVANITNYRKTYAPEVHRISESKDWESISKIIDEAKFSLSRYGIDYHIDNKSIIRYLKEKNFRDLSKIINNYPFESTELRNRLDNEQMTFQDYENLSFIEKQEFFPLHHINLSALQTVYKNYSSACSSLLERNFLFLFFFLGFGLAFIAVYFQIVKPIAIFVVYTGLGSIVYPIGAIQFNFPKTLL